MTAVNNGRPLDTTMGFTPTGGLMMATRCGDIDPGLLIFLLRDRGIPLAELERTLNRQSGLRGVSGRSADMRTLLELSGTDSNARAAVELFCHTARKYLGAMIAVLGGFDTLIFTGGIGEHASAIRAMICAGLSDIGVEIDPQRNAANEPVISPAGARGSVKVVHTNEELMMARYALLLIGEKPA
jgi:acetate kinase